MSTMAQQGLTLFPARFLDYLALTKPGITVMVLVTTAVGFVTAGGSIQGGLFFLTLLGTALASAGASTLNMVLEREPDARMKRTEQRPLPSGRVGVGEAAFLGVLLSGTGFFLLTLGVTVSAGVVAGATVATYILAYTPLKKVSSLCTPVGAVAGALPPVIGWAAIDPDLSIGAWVLFAILFFWQMPHFLAIAWIYREDYRRGGFPMLSVMDSEGTVTARQVALNGLALLLASLAPSFLGMVGPAYFPLAALLGLLFLGFCLHFAFGPSEARGRSLFFASLVYLPVLILLLMFST